MNNMNNNEIVTCIQLITKQQIHSIVQVSKKQQKLKSIRIHFAPGSYGWSFPHEYS